MEDSSRNADLLANYGGIMYVFILLYYRMSWQIGVIFKRRKVPQLFYFILFYFSFFFC